MVLYNGTILYYIIYWLSACMYIGALLLKCFTDMLVVHYSKPLCQKSDVMLWLYSQNVQFIKILFFLFYFLGDTKNKKNKSHNVFLCCSSGLLYTMVAMICCIICQVQFSGETLVWHQFTHVTNGI